MGSVVVARGLNCSVLCGIFLNQGSNWCPFIARQILNHWTIREAWVVCLFVLLLIAPCSMGNLTSPTNKQTHAPCIGDTGPNYWPTREVSKCAFSNGEVWKDCSEEGTRSQVMMHHWRESAWQMRGKSVLQKEQQGECAEYIWRANINSESKCIPGE